jgi:hypothetical protein
MEKLDYEKDVEIDENDLDIECLNQASLFAKYARNATNEERKVELLKEKLTLLKAELDLQIRTSPEKFKIEKITEAVVTNTIIVQKEFQELNKELLNAQFEKRNADNAVKSMDQKKSMLEALIKLHGQNYFAGPQTPRDLHLEREQKDKKVNQGISSKMQRIRK